MLQKLTGPGTVFLHAAGDCVEFDLRSEEEVSAELGSMIYHDSTVDYTVKRAGGIGTVFLGGEGIVLAHFVGPGRVALQTMLIGGPLSGPLVNNPLLALAGRLSLQTAAQPSSVLKSPCGLFSGLQPPFLVPLLPVPAVFQFLPACIQCFQQSAAAPTT